MEATSGDEPLPDVNFDDAAPQTRLLEKRRQMYDASVALDKAKAEFAAREDALKEREGARDHRDEQFRLAMLESANLLIDNEAKRKRAERRTVDEKRAAEQKGAELVEGVHELNSAQEDLQTLETAKGKLQAYYDYLSNYQADRSTEFQEIASILDRFSTLKAAQRDLIDEADRLQDELEHKRGDVSRAAKARHTAVLNADNVLTSLRERIELTRAEVLALQQGAESATARHARRTRELGQVLQSVANLHARCTRSRYGHAIKHNPADAEVLGRPIPDFSEELGLPPVHSPDHEDSAPTTLTSLDDSTMALVGPGMEGEEWLADTMEAVKLGATGGGTKGHGSSMGHGSGAHPVFLAVASPRKKVAVDSLIAGGEGEGTEDGGGASPGKGKAKVIDVTGMDPAIIRDKVRTALGQLYVVGAYIQDLQILMKEYPAWLGERRKHAAEVAQAAAAEAAAAAGKTPLQMKLAAKAAAGAASKPTLSSASGPLASSTGAGVGVSSAGGPSTPAKKGTGMGASSMPFSPITLPAGKSRTGVGASNLGISRSNGAALAAGASVAMGATAWAGASTFAFTSGGAIGQSEQADRVAAVLQRQGMKVYTVSASVSLPPPTDPIMLPLDKSMAGRTGGMVGVSTTVRGTRMGGSQDVGKSSMAGTRSPAKSMRG